MAKSEASAIADVAPEGDDERVLSVVELCDVYVELQRFHPEVAEQLPIDVWEQELTAKLDAEIVYWQAQVDGWEGEVPSNPLERPSFRLRWVHGAYVAFAATRGDPVETVAPHLVGILTKDRIYDLGEDQYNEELEAIAAFQRNYGRIETTKACRAAVDVIPKDGDTQRNLVIFACEVPEYASWRSDLSMWATPKEVEAFSAASYASGLLDETAQEQGAKDAAAEQQRQADIDAQIRQAQAGGSAGSGGGGSSDSSGGGAPSVVSVTLRNSCSHSVKIFYGEDPNFGSGTQSSLGGNSSQGHQMKPGDMIWVLDDGGKGLASASASSSTREIEVSSSCTSISAH